MRELVLRLGMFAVLLGRANRICRLLRLPRPCGERRVRHPGHLAPNLHRRYLRLLASRQREARFRSREC